MSNRDLEAARHYHQRTKHSPASVRSNPHFLDWQNQPFPFKVYPGLEAQPLPRDVAPSGGPALAAAGQPAPGAEVAPDLAALARLLYFSAGITRKRAYPGGEIYFRAAACTGALYEIELYVVCGDLPGLPAGVYHFTPAEFGLRQLRAGDFRGALAAATAAEPAGAHAPLSIVCSAIYWRNAWKYQARTYRHFGWDNGTILANFLAVSAASGLPARLVMGFVDREVDRLLGLDGEREVAFSVVAVGRAEQPPPRSPAVTALALPVLPMSRREVDYPLMREVHAASSLTTADEVAEWRAAVQAELPAEEPAVRGPLVPLRTLEVLPPEPVEQVILRRGSTRKFDPHAIMGFEQLSTLLDVASRGVSADFLPPGAQLNDLYLVVHAVEGLAPGAYFFRRRERALELLKAGTFRNEAAYLGLEQELPGDACVDVFFLADLENVLVRMGNRGYRCVQLEAGVLGGRLYLGAYAQELGATGLTFYDDAVVEFFSPHARGKSAIFLVAVGRRQRKEATG